MRTRFALLAALAVCASIIAQANPRATHAQEGWVIESFDVEYFIDESGVVQVLEDIQVDFGDLQRHGIFREMPVRYAYDDEHDRVISVGPVYVDDGEQPREFELISSGANLQIKIGDPDVLVAGRQRYRIGYLLGNALNPQPDGNPWDEFFWNVTGNDWETTVEKASATVTVPESGAVLGIRQVDCFQGPAGSREACDLMGGRQSASFEATHELPPGSGLTLVVALELGLVYAPPPVLVPVEQNDLDEALDLFDIHPWIVALSLAVGAIGVAAVARLWWLEGRDRWYGDMFYLNDDGVATGTRKPIGARETVVVEYQPPEVSRTRRRLRPAEIGLLLDERADTLDVTATIVDLAVRDHLRIKEERSGGIFGLFQQTDYELERLEADEELLLPYEEKLKNALFDSKGRVKLSTLKNKFSKDLERVKEALYKQSVEDRLFPRDPDTVRNQFRLAGFVIAGAGAAIAAGLGYAFGGALIGVPIVVSGLALAMLAGMMPRRTARGRVLYRRALGFRRFMVTAETERQRFAEEKNIFHDYLPYAIVYECVDKWAKVFEDLGLEPQEACYYAGTRPFSAAYFASSMAGFSSSVSTTMASTPGGRGGSGFGGGGGSGGGGGGGGGGSW